MSACASPGRPPPYPLGEAFAEATAFGRWRRSAGCGMMKAMSHVASAAPRAVEPIDYVTGNAAAGTRRAPPMVIPLIGGTSCLIALLTVGLSAWLATQTYYVVPHEPPPRTPPVVTRRPVTVQTPPPPRVSVEQGNAIVDGVGRVLALTEKERQLLAGALAACEKRIEIRLPPDATADTVAAALREKGAIFNDDASYAIVGSVRVEVSESRAVLESYPSAMPRVEVRKGGYSTVDGPRGAVLSFAPAEEPEPMQASASPPRPAAPAPLPAPSPPRAELTVAEAMPLFIRYGDAAISALLAILLLVAGVGLLRYSPTGRTLHLAWAWVKLPLALSAAAAYFFVILDGQFPASGGVAPLTAALLGHPAFFASLLACLYALAVIAVMLSPPVRRYFRDQSPARSE